MNKITVLPGNKIIYYQPGPSLLEILLDEQVLIESPCNGLGNCGKCKVKHLGGSLPPMTQEEQNALSNEEAAAAYRLSCSLAPDGDLIIELPEPGQKHEILTDGLLPDFALAPAVRKKSVIFENPTLRDQTSYEHIIACATGCEMVDISLLRQMQFKPGNYTAVYNAGELTSIEPGVTTGTNYGLAVDIGTTTVVASLVDLSTGKELGVESMLNPQKQYGSDVLTRITYALDNPEQGLSSLQKTIVEAINNMTEKLCTSCGINCTEIYNIVVAGNSTMHHILLGVDPSSLGIAPYVPIFTKSWDIAAAEIGLKGSAAARLYCLPAVSAYIGADIVAGVYASELYKKQGNVLFIDIGTNGEIVLSHRGKLMSCSCAAGPALEGMNISCGMRAAKGAVENIRIRHEGVELDVIGGGPPRGLCGSGIMAAICECLRTGLICKDGALQKANVFTEEDFRFSMMQQDGKKRSVKLADPPNGITITQKDIRQVQLAKGAILSGFYTLLNQAGLSMNQLDKVLIAGQFGAHLSTKSLIGCGILPSGIENKLEYIGNTSKTGAYAALLSLPARQEMEYLASQINYVELSATPGYEKLFVKCLEFPPAKE